MNVTTSDKDAATYVIRGYVVATRSKPGAKFAFIWDVNDLAGKRLTRVAGDKIASSNPKDPWAAFSTDIAAAIATETATAIASWSTNSPATLGPRPGSGPGTGQQIAGEGGVSFSPFDNGPPTLTASVAAAKHDRLSMKKLTMKRPKVSGAPGDGNIKLAVAMQRELANSNVVVGSADAAEDFTVSAQVTLDKPAGSKQPVRIEWVVLGPGGKRLGAVQQQNEIKAGSLDKTWDGTAEAAAAAAAQGVIKLMRGTAVPASGAPVAER